MSEEQITMEELLKQAGSKIKKHDERQDYLAAIARYIESNLTEQEFDNLTDEAALWYDEAVKAINSNLEIPDFDVDDNSQDPGYEGEVDEEPATTVTEPDDGDTGAGDVTPRKGKKSKRGSGDNSPKKAGAAKAQKPASPTPDTDKKRPDYASLTGEKDKFGVVIGTKTHEAVLMYEKGCTASQLMDTLGGRFYNILTKLGKEGHHVDKLEGGVWKLIHKDEYGKKAKGK